MLRILSTPKLIRLSAVTLLVGLSAMIAAAAFLLFAQFTTAAPDAVQRLRSGSFGITQGQAARFSVVNTGKKDLSVSFCFIDETGLVEITCNGMIAEKGATYWMDLDGDTVADKLPARVQLRAEVKVSASDNTVFAKLRSTIEVYDKASGQTIFFYPSRVDAW